MDGREETLVLSWPVSSSPAKAEIKDDPVLSARFAGLKEKEGVYLLRVLSARDGKSLGGLLVETGKGSFRISRAAAIGDWVVISDTENRVLVYSLSSGTQVGKTFGGRALLGRASGLLCVENERGQLTIYDVRSMEKRDQFIFSSPVSLTQFSPDGKRLFVLTASQTAYVLDLSSLLLR